MDELIKLNEALKIMETGEPFSMVFVSFDEFRKTGGKLVEVDEAILIKKKGVVSTRKPKRNPNHWTNSTRPFKRMVAGYPTSAVRRFHIFLLVSFNGKKVYL